MPALGLEETALTKRTRSGVSCRNCLHFYKQPVTRAYTPIQVRLFWRRPFPLKVATGGTVWSTAESPIRCACQTSLLRQWDSRGNVSRSQYRFSDIRVDGKWRNAFSEDSPPLQEVPANFKEQVRHHRVSVVDARSTPSNRPQSFTRTCRVKIEPSDRLVQSPWSLGLKPLRRARQPSPLRQGTRGKTARQVRQAFCNLRAD